MSVLNFSRGPIDVTGVKGRGGREHEGTEGGGQWRGGRVGSVPSYVLRTPPVLSPHHVLGEHCPVLPPASTLQHRGTRGRVSLDML